MGKYVAENLVKNLIRADIPVKQARVAILGFTFKEDCPDIRNTRVIDIVNELKEYGLTTMLCDPQADAGDARTGYGIELASMDQISNADAVILAVGHREFMDLSRETLDRLFRNGPNHKKVLMDIKGILNKQEYDAAGYSYWRL